jgi:dihydrofolate reductase
VLTEEQITMKIALIAAHDDNLIIGKDGDLPWHIPSDLAHFMKHTKGNTLVMGRKTWESIGAKPLKNRENIVISRTGNWDNVAVFPDLQSALRHLSDRPLVYIGGGSGLYKESLPLADQLVITHVLGSHSGDTYFPEYRNDIGTIWKEVNRQDHETHSFIWYDRIKEG